MTAQSRQDRRLASERRLSEAALLRCLYPHLTAGQVDRLLNHARYVRLVGGVSLAAALGR